MRWTLDKYQECKLLAKSETNEELSLKAHLVHVASGAEKVAEATGKDINLARTGALLHDIGKAHPTYQGFIHDHLSMVDLQTGIPHRHEFSSLAFLPLFEKENWPALVEMVAAHHKSIKEDSSERGLLDIVNRYRLDGLLESHLKDWHTWAPRATETLNEVGIDTREISIEEAQKALQWAYEFCEKLDDGWSEWKGLLMASDHMASALSNNLQQHLSNLFQQPQFVDVHDPNPLYPLSVKDTKDDRAHTLVVAPTGAGKTDYLLKRCRGRVFYLLPFQASINAMYNRIKEMVPEQTDVRLLHSASRLVEEDESREKIQLQPFVGANIKVLTPHQISNIIFGSRGFEANLLDLHGCDIILDEVHTYEAETQAMVVEIVKVLLQHDCKIHIGTATMPTALYEKLLKLMGGSEQVYEVTLSNKELQNYDRHIISKHPSIDELIDTIGKGLRQNEKILIVLNTVKESQNVYEQLSAMYPNIPSMLLHSRFRRKDRRDREQRLELDFNKGDGPCFVVSTQVVEVSLDINFDRMVTQAAPLDALIQRFGRVNRERLPESERTLKPIHVIEPADNTLPYQKAIVEKSFDLLPDQEKLETTEVQSLIDEVYPDIAISEITGHCCWKGKELWLKKLRHITEPVLLKLLEIDSESCILGQDYEEYLEADWKKRQWLEIPVNRKSLYSYKDNLQRAEVGSEPFIMTEQNRYDELGLQLKQASNFI